MQNKVCHGNEFVIYQYIFLPMVAGFDKLQMGWRKNISFRPKMVAVIFPDFSKV
jgi:hypothetical protein